MDTIHVGPADQRRFYVYTLIDLTSRWAFAWVSRRINTHRSLSFVKLAQRAASFQFKMIQTDNGPEFSKWFSQRVGELGLTHRHSRVRQSNDNAHVERFNRTLQEECLDKKPPLPAAYQRAIREYLPYYNGRRLHLGINFQTPAEILKAIPSY